MAKQTIDLDGYDPMDPSVQQDPFAHYRALRQQAPVYRHSRTGVYFVSRYETVRRVLGDTATFSSRMSNAPTRPESAEVRAEIRRRIKDLLPPTSTLITADPPRHTRYRRIAARALSARRLRLVEPHIRGLARDLLGSWPAGGRVDFMNSFAVPFPVRVIARLLGLKHGCEADVKRWSDDSVAALGVEIEDARRLEALGGIIELERMWVQEVEERRRQPGDDLVSELIAATIEDDDGTSRPLTVPELVSILQQLMVAGNETTTKLLNELVRILAECPDEWRRLREDPERIPAVVEEGLRLASPNQGLFRQLQGPVELDGVEIPAGATVWLMFGSANRDEEVFPDPDRFDPGRANLREHLAFGFGAHFCVGAPLARLEARVALEELAVRTATLRVAPGAPLRYEPSFILRGLSALEIEVADRD